MSGKHLRGVENTTLRRRILRAERDILLKPLREPRSRRRRGGAVHGPDPDPAPQPPLHGPRPVSEAQTLIGTHLPLPPDHPAASWLSTSWTVPGLADLLGQSPAMPPTLPSPDAGRWRSHGIHSATPAPQPPSLHAEATLAATPRAGSKRSFASMDVRQPDGDPAVCAKRGCPDLPATAQMQAAQRHSVCRTALQTQARATLDSATLGPKNECHQTDADPDTVHTSITRAEYPSTDFACFASAPSGNSFAQAASISTDFSRVTSEENRAFARLLSSSAHGTLPGFLVGGAGALDSHACEFPMASQAGGGIEDWTEAGHSFPRAASISSDLARLTPEGDRVLSYGVHFPQPGSEGWTGISRPAATAEPDIA